MSSSEYELLQQYSVESLVRVLPEGWGHRGAPARSPENTLVSFEAAISDGSDGIESDVRVSADGVVIMFHDPSLERITGSLGKIKERNWYGEDGMQHLRTIKSTQPIPTFVQTVELLMKPENQHVKFNIDVKVDNNPDQVFKLMHEIISSQPSWETALAPRILLGLWHPHFLEPAKRILGYCKRSFIGISTYIARKYFWNDCGAFSMAFFCLACADGEMFIEECKKAGKYVMVWTVNEPAHMMEAVRWGVDGIITNATEAWVSLRKALQEDYKKTESKYGRGFLWTNPLFYFVVCLVVGWVSRKYLELIVGRFEGAAGGAVEDDPEGERVD